MCADKVDFASILDFTSSALNSFNMGNSFGGMINPNVRDKSGEQQNFANSLNGMLAAQNKKSAKDKAAVTSTTDPLDGVAGAGGGATEADVNKKPAKKGFFSQLADGFANLFGQAREDGDPMKQTNML